MKRNDFKLNWISFNQSVLFMCFCLACPLWGQVIKKKNIEVKDYSLWHHISPASIDENGKWTSFHKYTETGEDTLVIKHVESNKTLLFANGYRESFPVNSNSLLFLNDDGLESINLKSNTQITIRDVVDYKTSANGKYFAAVQEVKDTDHAKSKNLLISEIGGEPLITISNIVDYNFDNSSTHLAFSQKSSTGYQISVLKLKNQSPVTLLEKGPNPYKKIIWGADKSLAFFEELEQQKDNRVHWIYNIDYPNTGRVFNPTQNREFPYPIKVVNNIGTTLHFSPDEEILFFHIQKQVPEETKTDHGSNVQVWNSKDLLIYPSLAGNESFLNNPPIMFAFDKKDGKLKQMGKTVSSQSVWGSNGKYVFTYSLLDDVPGTDDPWEEYPIFVYNTVTGKEQFVISRTEYMPIQISPTGRYLNYFDNTDWWIYDAELNVHHNITRNIPSNFRNDEYDYSGVKPPYGLAGWTSSDEEVLLYDEFGIWAIQPDGTNFKKLTDEIPNGSVARIYKPHATTTLSHNFLGYRANTFDLKKGILVKTNDRQNGNRGLYYLKDNIKIQTLVYGDSYISNAGQAINGNKIFYSTERYMEPPAIHMVDLETKENTLLYQSNPQHEQFNWGKSELIGYTNPINPSTKLNGALFYPSNFNPKLKYPMVVFIYEKMSDRLHKYKNPSLYNGADLNISNFTTRDYFVFCPDIAYKINEPGISALSCVTAGVEEVLKKGFVNRNRLGLFGHSFGGFETSFIVTQTDLFAAAISGSGYHNILSFYLSVAWGWQKPQAARFLHDQQRFAKNYFDIPDLYLQNSPINFVKNLKTPLLTYTGDKDENINWQQSVEMYNALRVLNKEHIMLIYPNEGHDFFNFPPQVDFTYKMWEWFDHYLKGEPKKTWMKKF